MANTETNAHNSMSSGAGDGQEAQSAAARTALAEEAVLNAAVAFAAQVATGAQQSAIQTAHSAPPALQEVVVRQFLLETATLCLRRLGESYEASAAEPGQAEHAAILGDGARQAAEARAAVEAIGDLGLDLLDRLMEES